MKSQWGSCGRARRPVFLSTTGRPSCSPNAWRLVRRDVAIRIASRRDSDLNSDDTLRHHPDGRSTHAQGSLKCGRNAITPSLLLLLSKYLELKVISRNYTNSKLTIGYYVQSWYEIIIVVVEITSGPYRYDVIA